MDSAAARKHRRRLISKRPSWRRLTPNAAARQSQCDGPRQQRSAQWEVSGVRTGQTEGAAAINVVRSQREHGEQQTRETSRGAT
jgi:hypothetical protein